MHTVLASPSEGSFPAPVVDRAGHGQSFVVAIGGGKGGIGKSMVTANLGICFALNKWKVVLVDADLGGSNLHTCLGVDLPERSLSDFVQKRVTTIEETIVETGVKGLGLISGAEDFLKSANIKYVQKLRVLKEICKIDSDLILIDLGSGTSYNVLDFFLIADLGIVTIVPEPTSLENSYRFIKSSFYRLLRHREKSSPFQRVIEEAMESRSQTNLRTPHDLIKIVSTMDAERGVQYQAWMKAFTPRLLVNQIREPEDRELGAAVSQACRKYFGIDLDYLGCLPYDDAVWKSIRQRTALLIHEQDSSIAQAICQVTRDLATRLLGLIKEGSGKT